MNKLNIFDVLIVYTESLAKSASNNCGENISPFPKGSPNESYNLVYGYFLEICYKFGLKAAFTTSADIVGAGQCSSFWIYENEVWQRINSSGFSSLIFDKFSPTKKRIKNSRSLLFSSEKIKSFNDPELFNLFFDKQKTYDRLVDYSIPTVSIEKTSIEGVMSACQKLTKLVKEYPTNKDFSNEIVMKDRYGAGGRRVFKFGYKDQKKMLKKIRNNPIFSYIIQPLVKFDKGFLYKNSAVPTDIRLIYLNGKIVQSYIRRAVPGDFRCNEHQGGTLTYLSKKDIPRELIERSNLISERLEKPKNLYALDFLISNDGNIYFLEGNVGPGLDWNVKLKKNEIEAKKLIRLIVSDLAASVESESLNIRGILPRSLISNYHLNYSV